MGRTEAERIEANGSASSEGGLAGGYPAIYAKAQPGPLACVALASGSVRGCATQRKNPNSGEVCDPYRGKVDLPRSRWKD
jgi:hypothetical protein